MRLGDTKLKSLVSAIFVGILLFNYVSSTMFWHCHVIDGQIITHSHIYGDGHACENSDGGHTFGQLKLLDILSHIVCTDTIIPDISISRIDVLEYVFSESPVLACYESPVNGIDLRGPPSLI
ncbi:MAG: hypothetical protein J5886_05875 [Bacteroidales bacterium]|nr:hypothetical protein [Bacteroidales bacterium]